MSEDALAGRIQALEDQQAIVTTMHRYCHGIDYGPPEDFADCFVAEGIYEAQFPGSDTPRLITGHAALEQFAADHPVAPDKYWKHFVLAPVITLRGDEADVVSVMGRIDDPPGGPLIDVIGRYRDHLVRCDDGRWRFTRRISEVEVLAPSFASPALADDD